MLGREKDCLPGGCKASPALLPRQALALHQAAQVVRHDNGAYGTRTMTEKTRQVIRQLSDSFRQFARNGRWGTCASCPRDSENHAYPEFCQFTERYDHNLDVDDLAATWKNWMRP